MKHDDRLTAIFDLDGVFIENPAEARIKDAKPITDLNYWERHWSNPAGSVVQHEMVRLARMLLMVNWRVIVLTARPETYAGHTRTLLRILGLQASTGPDVLLVMIPQSTIGGSAEWKQQIVKRWRDEGMKIQFMVEDYRINAEAIRSVVPVLLYECKRPSNHLPLSCRKCGGLAACWCPAESQVIAAG